jgi:hypothetical protein
MINLGMRCWVARRLAIRDATALMQCYGATAYREARERARQVRLGKVIDLNREEGHWDRVSLNIARRTEPRGGGDTPLETTEKGVLRSCGRDGET